MNEQRITDTEDVVEPGAPAQPSPGEGATAQDQTYYSDDELRAMYRDEVREALKEHWAGVDRVETRNRDRIDAQDAAIAELMEGTRGLKSLLERVAKNAMTDEDWNSIEKEELKQRAEKAEAALNKKETPPKTDDPQPDPQALLKFELERYHVPALQRYAQKRGVKLEDAGLVNERGQWQVERGPEGRDPTDPYGWNGFLADAERLIDTHADKVGLVKEPVEIDERRPGGVASGSGEQAYKAWLDGKGPQPAAEVIDRLTAKYLART